MGFYSCHLPQTLSSQSPHTPVLTPPSPCRFFLTGGRASGALEMGRAIHKVNGSPEGPGGAPPRAEQQWESAELPLFVSVRISNYTSYIYFCWMDFVVVEKKQKKTLPSKRMVVEGRAEEGDLAGEMSPVRGSR